MQAHQMANNVSATRTVSIYLKLAAHKRRCPPPDIFLYGHFCYWMQLMHFRNTIYMRAGQFRI
jgi:hypothetical protein